MKLLRGIQSLAEFENGIAVSIGNFDGVHLGHQALLKELKKQALLKNLSTIVVLFEPQPNEFFYRETAPVRLSSLREKIIGLKECGVDYVCRLQFNHPLALMSAQIFAEHYLFNYLKAKFILLGNDFRFGCYRQGNANYLSELAHKREIEVALFPDFSVNHQRVSSTSIRHLLNQGYFKEAQLLLGRPYSWVGRVISGEGRGRKWGIPTANIARLDNKLPPMTGVFCVQVQLANGSCYQGVANLGRRPTVNGTKIILEVHLIEIELNLYGKMLEICFLHKIRDEIKFPSQDELIAQIHHDIVEAKRYFLTL